MVRKISWSKGFLSVLAVALVMFAAAAEIAQGRVLLALTPTPVEVWSGHTVSVTEDLSLRGSVLRVSVMGVTGLPVKVSTADGSWSATGLTGSKTEFGEFMVEFAALSRGDYVVEPQGLGTSLPLYSDTRSYVTVEFTKGPAPSMTSTQSPSPSPTQTLPTWTPSFTSTPRPTPTATFTPVPLAPTATPIPTSTSTRMLVTPTASPSPLVTTVSTQSTRALWSGRIAYTMGGYPRSPGTVVVRVLGQVGLPVELKLGSFRVQAVTGSKSEYGDFACEFGGLPAGVYTVNPHGVDSSVTVDLGHGEFAMVEFSPSAAAGAATSVPVVPTVTRTVVVSTPVVQPTPPAFSVLYPPARLVISTPAVQAGAKISVSGVMSPSLTVQRPASEPVWTAQVSQRVPGAENSPATLVVRVLGARGLPVTLKADGWQTRALTGSKVEHGEFACEFGGLPAGEYEIIPDGIDLSYRAEVGSSEFVLVDFAYTIPELSAIPKLAIPSEKWVSHEESWSGRVVSRTVGLDGDETWGSVVVEVLALEGLPVEVRSAGGWSAFKLTETRDGYDGFVSEFVRLSPGIYQVVPEGLGAWIELTISEGSQAWIEFASR